VSGGNIAAWATPAVKVLFRVLWGDGLSTSEMARQLSTDEYPLTKNMIVNQARTLLLARRPSPVIRGDTPSSTPRAVNERARARKLRPPRPLPPLIDKPVAVTPRPVIAAPPPVVRPPPSYLPRTAECCWPLGTGRQVRFCDADTVPGMPYCEGHCELAYETKGWRQRVGDAATMGGD
jgi:GcrA cell cycle regulator